MKKIIALLLILLVSVQVVAAAEAVTGAEVVGDAQAATEQLPVKLILRVVDGQGSPLTGAQVTVRNMADEAVYEYIADASGVANIDTLPAGVYKAKAVDPSDGYSSTQSFNLLEDTAIDLIVRKLADGSKVAIGSGTEVSGKFFTEMWGNNTSDIDVRAMLHGYSTIAWTNEATYVPDSSVVTVAKPTVDAAGNKTYTFDVNPGLTYNDGTPIDARDYVFSVLLQSAPQMKALGASTLGYSQLAGFTAYNAGKNNIFSGVRLIDQDSFSLTIYKDYLPYFYEMTYVNVTPYPISVIAPGFTVADDGKGAYITPVEGEQEEFTSELLEKTILDPLTGYQSHPMVSSGPYQLVSYDPETATVSFKANRAYKGNYEGQRPLIDEVTLAPVKNAEALDKLQAGTFNIINKMSDNAVILKGVELYGSQALKVSNYLRSGYGFIGFANEQGPTASVNVRKAISLSLDKEAYAKAFTGDNGQTVYSYYGLGQWMTTDYVNQMRELMTTYPLDLEAAKALLVEDGWTLNDKGNKFVEGTDVIRYKLLKGNALKAYNKLENPVVKPITIGGGYTLLPLEVNFAKLKDSQAAQLLDEMLTANLKSIGFDVKVTDVEFNEMLAAVNRQSARTYNMFAYATNFTYVFDPYFAFNDAAEYQGSLNQFGIKDAKLLKLAKTLRETTPGDEATYVDRWLKLMKQYSDVLPTVPLYSNVYYDFTDNTVQDYLPNAHWSWSAALMYTYIGEPLVLSNLLEPAADEASVEPAVEATEEPAAEATTQP
jgi:peptide/nickel transport system substrate-binding protein